MTKPLVDQVADAVLYEGYTLYPYRPSVKSRQRWTFGGLLPKAYCESHGNHERWQTRTQCLLEGMAGGGWMMDDGKRNGEGPCGGQGIGQVSVSLRVRFLHLTERTVGRLDTPTTQWNDRDDPPAYQHVDQLRVGDQCHQPWQEARQRDIDVPIAALADLLEKPRTMPFAFPAHRTTEPLRDEAGRVVGLLLRDQQAVTGEITLGAQPTEHDNLYRLTASVANHTTMDHAEDATRDDAVLGSFASTHLVLRTDGGSFVSMIDPPGKWRGEADKCKNDRCWPVLVGEEGDRDTVLAAPIILYDYPRIAPQSPGDLFDATEIDEILSLRIMTLTEEEKREAGATDPRVREMLQRTESLARDQLMGLHGTMKQESPKPKGGSRKTQEEAPPPPPSDFRFPASASPSPPISHQPSSISHQPSTINHPEKPATARVGNVELRRGDRVRLNPASSADAFDVVLRGMTATIADIEQDYENRVHLAVTIDEDPGADFGQAGKPGHRFFFTPDDVEPLAAEGEGETP